MADKKDGVGDALAAAPAGAITASPQQEFSDWMRGWSKTIVAALPADYAIDSRGQEASSDQKIGRFVRTLSTEVRRNPALWEPVRRTSLLAAMCLAAQLGLEPGPMQRVFFIPYGDEVQFQLGWRGLSELMMRSGTIAKITTAVIREGDVVEDMNGKPVVATEGQQLFFDPDSGTILHRAKIGDAENRPVIAAYATVVYTNGQRDIEVMDLTQLDKIKDSALSKARDPKNPKLPWNAWTDEMQRKSPLKRLAKRVPMSEEDARAIETDEGVYKTIEPRMVEVPDTRDHGDVFGVSSGPEPSALPESVVEQAKSEASATVSARKTSSSKKASKDTDKAETGATEAQAAADAPSPAVGRELFCPDCGEIVSAAPDATDADLATVKCPGCNATMKLRPVDDGTLGV